LAGLDALAAASRPPLECVTHLCVPKTLSVLMTPRNHLSWNAIHAALEDVPSTKARAATVSIELRYLPPDALDALVARETQFWAKTIKSASIAAD
jgi:hypothetical protein